MTKVPNMNVQHVDVLLHHDDDHQIADRWDPAGARGQLHLLAAPHHRRLHQALGVHRWWLWTVLMWRLLVNFWWSVQDQEVDHGEYDEGKWWRLQTQWCCLRWWQWWWLQWSDDDEDVKLCGKLTDVLANFHQPRLFHSAMNQFRLMIIKITIMVNNVNQNVHWSSSLRKFRCVIVNEKRQE